MKEQRLIGNIIAEAAKSNIALPWARGTRRTEWIAKRAAKPEPLKAVQ